MPSRCTSASTTSLPKASAARMAALAAASWPSTSAVGSRSARPELLGLAQDVVVAGALLLHAGEDVVGRAVDDPHDPDDLLAGQRLAQRPDDGDGAGHRRLVEQVDAGGGGHLGQLGAGHGEQRLVGRDHRLAVAQGRLDQLVGGVEPPDDLDHHVDVVAGDQRGGVGADEVGRDGGGPRAAPGRRRRSRRAPGGCRCGRRRRRRGRAGSRPARRRRCRSRAGRRARSEPGARAGGHGRSPLRWPGRRSPPNGTGWPRRRRDRCRRARQASRRVRSSKVSRRTTTRAVPSETKTTAGRGTLL